jgi:hypothetical protein
MQREQLQELLKRRPFHPFRLHLTDGRAFDVRYPRLTLLGQNSLMIGYPAPNDTDPDPPYDRTEWALLPLITRLEMLPAEFTPKAG